MATVQTQNLEPVPSQTPMLESDQKLITPTWMRWFTNMRAKINVINSSIVALAGNSGAGFLSSNGTGAIASRVLTAGSGITITNPDGVAGNPVISASASGGAPINIVNNTVTTYTVQATDLPSSSSSVGWVASNVATANSVQIDAHANQAIPVGAHLYVSEEGAGQTSIIGLAGVSLVGSTPSPVAKGVGEAVQIALNVWHIFGNLQYSGVLPTTWDPANTAAGITLSAGNLTATKTSLHSNYSTTRSTSSFSSGKYYFEVKVIATNASNYMIIGIITAAAPLTIHVGADANGYGYYEQTGQSYYNNVASTFGASFTTNDIIGVAIDFTANKVWFAKNNVWQASGSPSTGTNPAYTITAGAYFAACSEWSTTAPADKLTASFNTASLFYTPPTGFSPWGV